MRFIADFEDEKLSPFCSYCKMIDHALTNCIVFSDLKIVGLGTSKADVANLNQNHNTKV